MNEPPTPGTHPDAGTLLAGRYRLEQRVARGGMAEVFRGHDQLLDRAVAVKVFRFSTDTGSEQQRIEAEMRTLAGLRHQSLVTLYDANAGDDASGGAPFLVMEYVAGPTLRDRLASGPVPAPEVARLGADLARALQYVHANGIVHRDVKPANILLDESQGGPAAVKLTDFGIARITDGTRLTAVGSTIGTANYLSPEQARGQAVGPPSDVYSLGLVLLECVTGVVAYPGTGIEAAAPRLSRPPAIPANLGPDWVQLFSLMTALDPQTRPDAGQVAAALEAIRSGAPTVLAPLPVAVAGAGATTATLDPVGAVPGGTAVLPVPGSVDAARRRNRLLVAAAAMVVVVVGVIVAALISESGGPAGSPATSAPPARPTTSTGQPTRAATGSHRSTAVHTTPAPTRTPPQPPRPPKGHGHGNGHRHGHGNGNGNGNGGNGNGHGEGD